MNSWRQRVRELEAENALLREENESFRQQLEVCEKRIEALEHRLLAYENAHTPSSQRRKKNTPPREGPRFPGKPRGSTGGGVRLPEPDRTEDHTLDTCPKGHNTLQHMNVHEQRVLDLPQKPIECVLHRVHQYWCTTCKAYCAPSVVLPHGVYGPRLQAASTQLKARGLSLGQISRFWQTLGSPSICAPTILEFTRRATHALRRTRAAFLHQVRQADVAHKDETGIRRDGQNWWCWISTTPDTCVFFIDPSRSQAAAQRLVGKTDQVSVTDGYAAYNMCKRRQRCWAHPLREAKDAIEYHPEIKDQTDRLNTLFQRLNEWVDDQPATHHASARWELDDIITCLKTRGNAGSKLATHIENGGDDWLTALLIPGVPLTNNLAERRIRAVVLLRKRIGCFRNECGADFIEVVLSVLTTWEVRGVNPFVRLTAALT